MSHHLYLHKRSKENETEQVLENLRSIVFVSLGI